MIIYSIKNRTSGKRYVGLTIRALDKRLVEHKRSPLPIGNALRKHGLKAFDVDVLEECDDEVALSRAEKKWIAHFDTFNGPGYNCTEGGEGTGSLRLGCKHTDEAKAKMSEARAGELNPNFGKFGEAHPKFGYKMSEASKKQLSEARSGPLNHNFGKTMDPDHKKKWLDACLKGRQRAVKQYCKKTGQFIAQHESLLIAAQAITSAKGAKCKIYECCKGTRKSHLGYTWKYADTKIEKAG